MSIIPTDSDKLEHLGLIVKVQEDVIKSQEHLIETQKKEIARLRDLISRFQFPDTTGR